MILKLIDEPIKQWNTKRLKIRLLGLKYLKSIPVNSNIQ